MRYVSSSPVGSVGLVYLCFCLYAKITEQSNRQTQTRPRTTPSAEKMVDTVPTTETSILLGYEEYSQQYCAVTPSAVPNCT